MQVGGLAPLSPQSGQTLAQTAYQARRLAKKHKDAEAAAQALAAEQKRARARAKAAAKAAAAATARAQAEVEALQAQVAQQQEQQQAQQQEQQQAQQQAQVEEQAAPDFSSNINTVLWAALAPNVLSRQGIDTTESLEYARLREILPAPGPFNDDQFQQNATATADILLPTFASGSGEMVVATAALWDSGLFSLGLSDTLPFEAFATGVTPPSDFNLNFGLSGYVGQPVDFLDPSLVQPAFQYVDTSVMALAFQDIPLVVLDSFPVPLRL